MRSDFVPVFPALVVLLAACAPPDDVPTFEVRRQAFRQQVTADGTLKAANVTPLTVPPEVKRTVRLAWLAPEGRVLAEGDLVARFDPKSMEELLEQGRIDLESATLKADKARVEGTGKAEGYETDLEIADLELGHARKFQKTDDSVFSRHEIIESEIDEELAGERKSHARDSLETQGSLSETELDLLAIEQRRAQLDIDQAEEGLRALEIRAPHGGILTLSRDWRGEVPQIGSEMWRGQELGEIPDLSTMEAEVFVLEADAGGLEVGKPAEVILEAHPERLFAGTLRRIDAVAKPRFRASPVQYFGVTVELEETVPSVMKPGQRVRAVLRLADFDDALVVPRQAVFRKDGATRVWLRNDGGTFTPRAVEIGAASMGLVVVADGLAEGDVVALREPAATDAPAATEATADERTAQSPEDRGAEKG